MRISKYTVPLLVSLVLIAASCTRSEKPDYLPVIPQPNAFEKGSGRVFVSENLTVSAPAGNEGAEKVVRYLGAHFNISDSEDATRLVLETDTALVPEAYVLDVRPSAGVTITSAPDGSGWFYGVQTLMQLRNAGEGTVGTVTVRDAPRFTYRGALMDPARNWLPKEEVLKFIDLIALYKLNVFHFHLTDDQGWRIEIDRYPRLMEVGSTRPHTQIGHSDYYFPVRFDGTEDSGYYTKDDIREIVAYAADRFVTVIPEIEMPGHASAALASYPELSCGLGKTYKVQPEFDVFDEVYCPKEETFEFLENVLDEVMELFPGKYINIGGDECPKKAWAKCAHCQDMIRRLGLADEHELQSYFIRRIEEHVNSRGRSIIGWDEILEGGLAPNATVLSWRGEEGGIEAARQGHDVIMAPSHWCYLDFYQQDPVLAPMAIGHYLPIDTVYSYNPVSEEIPDSLRSHVIGAQANIWGEYTQTPEYFEYLAFPRLLAMSEVQWTDPSKKNFENFCRVLDGEFGRLDAKGVNACRNFYQANIFGKYNTAASVYEVELKTLCPDAEIEYTVNDSTFSSPVIYREPFALDRNATVYARVLRDGKPVGEVSHRIFRVSKSVAATVVPSDADELIDGYVGTDRDAHGWTVLHRNDDDGVILTFPEPVEISSVSGTTIWRPNYMWWPLSGLVVEVTEDGETFRTVADESFTFDLTPTVTTVYDFGVSFNPVTAKAVRLHFKPFGNSLPGYYNAGEQTVVAIDEIEIN